MKKVIFILFALLLLSGCNNSIDPNEDLAKCISEKATLYFSTGCSACAKQKDLFGDSYKYLEKVDCVVFPEKCREAGLRAVPTWIINGEIIEGVQKLDKLKELTNC